MAMFRRALGPACLIASLIACQQGDLPANPDANPPTADRIKQAVDTRNQVMDAGGGPAGAGAETGAAISGQVSLGAGVSLTPGGTVFIIARKQGATGGPPLAVLNLKPESFPLAFSISQGNVMLPNTPFEGPMTIKVRYDADGNAMTKGEGDLEVEWPAPVSPGANNLSLVLGGAPGEKPAPAPGAPQAAPVATGAEAPTAAISGTISLAPGALVPPGAVLFVMARSSPKGPPVAVVRLDPKAFPTTFKLTEADTMMAGTPFAGALSISARLDSDGDAISKEPTDLVGESAGAVSVGTEGINLTLSPLGG